MPTSIWSTPAVPFTITAGAAPTWVTTSLPSAVLSLSYAATVLASNVSSYSLPGSPPSWLSINATTGVLSGTAPSSGTSVSVTLRATNGAGFTDVTLTIALVASPFITAASLTGGTTGVPYSITVQASPAAFSATGLPAGLSINTAGTISGTPAAGGLFTVVASAVLATGQTVTKAFGLQITQALSGGTVTGSASLRSVPRPRVRRFTAADFSQALLALLPRGRVWPRDPASVQGMLAAGIGAVYEQQMARSDYLLTDANPAFTYELMPEWESTLGLPDPCAGSSPTVQQRRGQILARLAGVGGQATSYFITLAADLGYDVTVSNFSPFRCGQSVCGDALGGPEWASTWSINAPTVSVVNFRAGQSAAGEPLGSWSNQVLECELNAFKPAQSVLQFRYH